jgi:hypothetical protein
MAPEGLFKGYSIAVSTFAHDLDWNTAFKRGELVVVAKAMLNPTLSKFGRQFVHKGLIDELDKPEAQNLGLALALFANLAGMKRNNAVVDYLLHSELQKVVDENPDCKAIALREEPSKSQAAA